MIKIFYKYFFLLFIFFKKIDSFTNTLKEKNNTYYSFINCINDKKSRNALYIYFSLLVTLSFGGNKFQNYIFKNTEITKVKYKKEDGILKINGTFFDKPFEREMRFVFRSENLEKEIDFFLLSNHLPAFYKKEKNLNYSFWKNSNGIKLFSDFIKFFKEDVIQSFDNNYILSNFLHLSLSETIFSAAA